MLPHTEVNYRNVSICKEENEKVAKKSQLTDKKPLIEHNNEERWQDGKLE